MKITQEPKFQPITITLETAKEAELLWDAVRKTAEMRNPDWHVLNELSNWFINHAQFGGDK